VRLGVQARLNEVIVISGRHEGTIPKRWLRQKRDSWGAACVREPVDPRQVHVAHVPRWPIEPPQYWQGSSSPELSWQGQMHSGTVALSWRATLQLVARRRIGDSSSPEPTRVVWFDRPTRLVCSRRRVPFASNATVPGTVVLRLGVMTGDVVPGGMVLVDPLME
jgi:hypothetical protein